MQIANYLAKKQNSLNNIVLRAQKLRALERLFLARIDPSLKNHIRLADVSGGNAVFLVDSPARASQLHYNSLHLLEILKSIPATRDIVKIRFKTGYWQKEPVPETTPPKPAGAATKKFSQQRQRLRAVLSQKQ